MLEGGWGGAREIVHAEDSRGFAAPALRVQRAVLDRTRSGSTESEYRCRCTGEQKCAHRLGAIGSWPRLPGWVPFNKRNASIGAAHPPHANKPKSMEGY
jgi:hypothetical protein